MGARLRPEGKDQGHERTARGERICQQRKTDISAAQAFGHDAGADHCDKEEGRRHEFGKGLVHNRTTERAPMGGNLQERHGADSPLGTILRWPISSTFRSRARRSSASSLKLVNSLMRVS